MVAGKITAVTIDYVTSTEPVRKKVVNLDEELNKANGVATQLPRRIMVIGQKMETDKPFSTNSAALAYDKKHDRLYYTPMGFKPASLY